MSYSVLIEHRDGTQFVGHDEEIVTFEDAMKLAEQYRGMAVSAIILNHETKEVFPVETGIEKFRADLDQIMPGWTIKEEK